MTSDWNMNLSYNSDYSYWSIKIFQSETIESKTIDTETIDAETVSIYNFEAQFILLLFVRFINFCLNNQIQDYKAQLLKLWNLTSSSLEFHKILNFHCKNIEAMYIICSEPFRAI